MLDIIKINQRQPKLENIDLSTVYALWIIQFKEFH